MMRPLHWFMVSALYSLHCFGIWRWGAARKIQPIPPTPEILFKNRKKNPKIPTSPKCPSTTLVLFYSLLQMCRPIFMVIGYYLKVAQAGDSFSILRNFSENTIRGCVCNKRYCIHLEKCPLNRSSSSTSDKHSHIVIGLSRRAC